MPKVIVGRMKKLNVKRATGVKCAWNKPDSDYSPSDVADNGTGSEDDFDDYEEVEEDDLMEELILENAVSISGQKTLIDYSQKKAVNTSLKENTALNLFDKFLLFVNDTSLDKLKKKDVTMELLGRFGSYMFQNCETLNKASPALAYMSHVKTKLTEVFKTDVFDKNPQGYQRLRNKMKEDFDDRQLKKGKPTVKKADGVGEEALLFASEILFDNTRGGFGSVERRFGNRLLLLMSRALVGRISEVRELKFEQFKYCIKAQCIMIHRFNRKKNSRSSDVHILPHAEHWQLCPIHALASFLVLMTGPIDEVNVIFNWINANKVAQNVNVLFKDFYKHWCSIPVNLRPSKFKAYTSHGMRHQAIEDMTDDDKVSFGAAATRAGLMLQSFNNLFNYISGSKKKDLSCARSLAGWRDANFGGKCPTLECLDVVDLVLFHTFTSYLFQNCVTIFPHKSEMSTCLSLILVMSFNDIYDDVKYNCLDGSKHVLLLTLLRALEAISPGVDSLSKLRMWSTLVKGDFRRQNGWFIKSSQLQEGDVVEAVPLRTDVELIKAELHDMNTKFNATASRIHDMEMVLRELAESVKSLTGLLVGKHVVSKETSVEESTPYEDVDVVVDKLKVNTLYSQACLEDFSTVSRPEPISFNNSITWTSHAAGIEIANVFVRWYDDQPFMLRKKNSDKYVNHGQLTMFARCIEYMKLFCDSDVIIEERPSQIVLDKSWNVQYDSWKLKLTRLSRSLQIRVMDFFLQLNSRSRKTALVRGCTDSLMAVSSLEFNKRLKMPVVTDRIMPSDSPFLLNFRDTILKGEDLFPQLVHRSSNAKIPNQLKKQLKINDKYSILSNFKRVLSDGETSITKKNKVLCTTNLLQRLEHHGLRNIGNSCYINVWMQTIYHCNVLRNMFLTSEPVSTSNPDLHEAMSDLFQLMDGGEGRKDDILRIIAKEVGHTGRQEDALQCFTECIASFTTVDNRSMWKNLFSFVVAKEWNAVSAGVIQIEEQHVEDFNVILPLEATVPLSVEAYLSKSTFMREGSILVTEKKSFHKTSNLLLLQITRFTRERTDNVTVKEYQHIDVPLVLMLPNVGPHSTQQKFSLQGIIVHQGLTVDSGHYYCYSKCKDYWIKASDDEVVRVDEITLIDFLKANYYEGDDTPYVLLYCKVKDGMANEEEVSATSENGYRNSVCSTLTSETWGYALAPLQLRLQPLTRNSIFIEGILQENPTDEVLIVEFNIRIKRMNYVRLRNGMWLDDEIINFFLNLLHRKNSNVYNFSTFFMDKLLGKKHNNFNYSEVKRWASKLNLLNLNHLFIPININNTHWSLVVVHPQQLKITYYDSMVSSRRLGTRYTNATINYLKIRYPQHDFSQWACTTSSCSVQPNYYDCGMYCLLFSDLITDECQDLESFALRNEQLQQLRLKYAYFILRGRIQYCEDDLTPHTDDPPPLKRKKNQN